MPLFASATPTETNGSDLLDQFEAVKAQYRSDMNDRASVVTARLAALEAEQADLKLLEASLNAADATVA